MKMPSEACFEMTRELLAGASPMGAYAMGVVTALASAHDLEPDRALLEEACRSKSAIEAWIYDAYFLRCLRSGLVVSTRSARSKGAPSE